MMKLKLLALAAAAVLLMVFASSDVAANPYTGYNTIGSYYQYQWGYTYSGNYGAYGDNFRAPGGVINVGNPYYNYPSTPRAGGWFGSGWTTGLRQPYYGCVAPTHFSYFSRPSCGGGYGIGGGYGYPSAYPVTEGTYRTRLGGGFIY